MATQNVWRTHGDWDARRKVLKRGFEALQADLVGFVQAIVTSEYDQARDLLGGEYHYAHQRNREEDGSGVSIASRWPIGDVREFDGRTIGRASTHSFAAGTLIAEIQAPIGRTLFVNHIPSWQQDWEYERELQTQSLDGTSVKFRDAWSGCHPTEPGHTFSPENPLVITGQGGAHALELGRRIDYIFVRGGDHGPTLDIRSCDLLFDKPVDGVWASDHFGVTAELSPLLRDGRPVP